MAEQKEIAPQEEVGSSTNVDKAVADNRKNVRAARKAPEDIFDLTKPIPRVGSFFVSRIIHIYSLRKLIMYYVFSNIFHMRHDL